MAVIAEMIPLDGGPHYPIGQTLTVVGRSEQCDIHIAHSSVSSRHCVCTGSEGFLAVRDLISTNGTRVNGQKVTSAVLFSGDRLTIGNQEFRIHVLST